MLMSVSNTREPKASGVRDCDVDTAIRGRVVSSAWFRIAVSTSQSRTPLAFGSLVLLTLMSIVLYYAIALAERIVVPWAPRIDAERPVGLRNRRGSAGAGLKPTPLRS